MTTHRPYSRRQGSLLIVAMILCAVIGISLVSYIQLSRSTLSLSTRSVYNNAAINVAEQAVEEALYSINKYVIAPTGTGAYAWPGWRDRTTSLTVETKTGTTTVTTNNKAKRLANIPLSQNATAEYRVMLYRYDQSNPFVISRAVIRFGNRRTPPIEKWLRVDFAKTSRFSNGMVARSNIRFTGSSAFVDSWNSLAADGTTVVPYSDAVNRDNGTIGSVSVAADAVATWNAKISGFVSTGGADPTDLVGPTGEILGDPRATYDPATWVKSTVDPNRISTNFSATFEPVTAPTATPDGNLDDYDGTGANPYPTELPVPAHRVSGTTTYYYNGSADIRLNSAISIAPGYNVIIRLTGDLSSAGNGGFSIPATASLVIYCSGDVDLAGNAIMNGTDSGDSGDSVNGAEVGRPIQFQLWGTSTTSQSISLSGTSDFSGVVYAPNANVTIGGTSKVFGSVVANTITMGGSAEFHYDESLGNFGGTNPFRVSRWRELTQAAERTFTISEETWDEL